MNALFWVCAGSAVGGGARHLVSQWALATFGPTFPAGTLVVNLVGSFVLAALAFVGVELGALPDAARLALTTGFLGGFTTFSTFSYETLRMAQAGAWVTAAIYLFLSVAGGLVMALLGWATARWLFG